MTPFRNEIDILNSVSSLSDARLSAVFETYIIFLTQSFYISNLIYLTPSCMLLENGQTPQDFKNIFDHSSTLCMKGLNGEIIRKFFYMYFEFLDIQVQHLPADRENC